MARHENVCTQLLIGCACFRNSLPPLATYTHQTETAETLNVHFKQNDIAQLLRLNLLLYLHSFYLICISLHYNFPTLLFALSLLECHLECGLDLGKYGSYFTVVHRTEDCACQIITKCYRMDNN